MTDRLSPKKIAENQASFRVANEEIEASADAIALAEPVPFICECPDLQCGELVHLTFSQYEEIRQHPCYFFTAPGHQHLAEDAGAAEVVRAHDEFVVVEKIGAAGDEARELDPRSD